MRSARRRLAQCVAVGISAALLTPAVGRAADGTVSGKVTIKVPKQAQASVVATSLADGLLLAPATIGKNGAFKVSLPAGSYALSTLIVPPPGGGAVSADRFPVSLRSGQKRTKINVKPKKRKVKGKKAIASRAYVQEKGQVTPGVTAFSIEDFTGAPTTGDWQFMNQAMADLLTTDLVGNTPCDTAVVANKRDRKLIENELELQKSKYFDPATRVKRNFIISDLTVSGTVSVAPDQGSAQVTVTISDARTGQLIDSLSSTLPAEGFFEAEEALAKQVAERVCRRPAAYKITLAIDGRGDFATHSATGHLDAELTALRSGGEAGRPPTSWAGVAQLGWSSVSFSSKLAGCTYGSPVMPMVTWQAQLAVSGDTQVKLDWSWAGNDMATGTVTCPSDNGPPAVIPGQPATALISTGPLSATLPLSGGTIPLTGGFASGGDGWTNTGTLVVTPIWAKSDA